MIRRLRKRFIRIATLAVTAVLLVLCLSVNIANYISVDSGLTNVLNVISDNRGTMPPMPHGQPPEGRPDGQLTKETPFSTRYFVLRYDGDGDLIKADLDKIAAVTEDDVGEYLSLALEHGEGYGYARGYKYRVVYNGEDRWMAIFLDDYQEMRSVREIALVSLAAMAGCVALVYVIVVLCSRRAIDPGCAGIGTPEAVYHRRQPRAENTHHRHRHSLKVLEMETGKQKWIDKAQTQTEKLTELVNSLVTLSRMDEEKTPLHFAPFAVSDAVRETAESFRDFAESNGACAPAGNCAGAGVFRRRICDSAAGVDSAGQCGEIRRRGYGNRLFSGKNEKRRVAVLRERQPDTVGTGGVGQALRPLLPRRSGAQRYRRLRHRPFHRQKHRRGA